MKDLVTDANFDCSTTGIALQAMDASHVSLVALLLNAEGFDHYRCDRSISLGLNLPAIARVLKCASGDDAVTLKADDEGDMLTLMFESSDQRRISEFQLKLCDIDSERLGIPETDYSSIVRMPSKEFQKVCRELDIMGDAVSLAVTKEGVTFSASGDLGKGMIMLRQGSSVDDSGKESASITVQLQEPVTQNFALRYLSHFAKASAVSDQVSLSLSPDVPLAVEFKMAIGYLRFYLAPKIGDEDQ